MLTGYDVVLNSQDTATLEKSLRVIRRGVIAVSISGPPDLEFARQKRLGPVIGLVMRLLSRAIRATARKADIRYTFLFMAGSGTQLAKLTKLIEGGVIRPVVDRVFPFAAMNDAMADIEAGRAKGKVVVPVT